MKGNVFEHHFLFIFEGDFLKIDFLGDRWEPNRPLFIRYFRGRIEEFKIRPAPANPS